ncbi:MAG: hypothetical protein IPQ19_14160 [Bacteroidetes bacterium]|nr:hypothetical protein [Bacteroidota bacterium]
MITIGIFAFKGIYKVCIRVTKIKQFNLFTKSRFTVVDRTNLSALKSEKELQKSEDFIDGYVVDQGKSFGAKYVVTGDLQNIGTVAKQFKKLNSDNTYSYSTQYSAYISFTLTLIETETWSN